MNFKVGEYGVCPDGVTLNTKAIQIVIDACNEAGGGVVVFDAGEYLTGSINLKSNVELHLAPGAKIIGSTNIGDYDDFISDGFKNDNAAEGTSKYLIGASYAENIAITGVGEINGSGTSFYDQTQVHPSGKFAKKPEQRPRIIMMHECRNVRFTEASFIDSPCWTFWIMKCEQVNIQRIRIYGDKRLINNDGIDIDSCKNVTVSDCFISTDDDCIIVRSIKDVFDIPKICENIVITNSVLESTCQCIRISCPSDYITQNCVFSNITMTGRNGINFDFPNRYLAKGSGGGAEVRNMSFSNMVINSTGHPIRIEVQDGVKLSGFRGVSFDNMRIKSSRPCVVKGNAETVIEDVSFTNITVETSADECIQCHRCRKLKFHNVEFNNG